ncbi:MAG TPA: hypothetical protein VN248_06145 [Arenimonas sp.]|nr:hypothetical protein [Arenimonas sp.]
MRGKIIHYNPNEAKGLISAEGKQYAFNITHWRSDSAPTVNTVVDFEVTEDTVSEVRNVPDDVLMKEKAAEFAGKLSAIGGKALGEAKTAAGSINAGSGNSALMFYGKPLLITHGIFAFSAIFLPFIKIDTGIGTKSFSLTGLADIQQTMGASLGGGALTWIAILALAIPFFWRSKFSWLVLLFPMLAVLQPVWGVMQAISDAKKQMGGMMGSEFGERMASQISSMLDIGAGAVVCFIAAAILAFIGVKRFILDR